MLEQLDEVAGRVEEQDLLAPGPSTMSLRNPASGSIVVVWFARFPPGSWRPGLPFRPTTV